MLTSNLMPVEPEETLSFDMIVELSAGRSSSTIMASVGRFDAAASAAALDSGGAEMEDEREVANAQLIVVGQQLPPGDGLAVQQRAVAAVQVLDVEVAVEIEDSGVLAADGARFEDDIAGGVPAEDHGRPFQGEQLPRIEPLQRPEYGHADTFEQAHRIKTEPILRRGQPGRQHPPQCP